MRTALLLGLGVTLLCLTEALAREDSRDANKKAPRFVGTWVIVAGEKEGEKEPEERIKGTSVRIGDDTVAVTDKRDKETYKARYKVDLSKRPHPIVMTATGAPDRGDTARGIIQLQGDTLKLCYALPGGTPPTEFATKPGTKQLLFVMKRKP